MSDPKPRRKRTWIQEERRRTLGDWVAEHRPDTHVVYMSGYTDNAIASHGVLEAGTRFLQKPFSPEALARTIREALS